MIKIANVTKSKTTALSDVRTFSLSYGRPVPVNVFPLYDQPMAQ